MPVIDQGNAFQDNDSNPNPALKAEQGRACRKLLLHVLSAQIQRFDFVVYGMQSAFLCMVERGGAYIPVSRT
jgi:hypothetical protein